MGLEETKHERTLTFAAIALGRIVELGLPADPQSFELWYIYATRQNEKLNDDVDDTLRRLGKLTEADLNRLYSLYVSSSRTANHLNAAAEKLTEELSQVTGMIRGAVASAERYDQKLHEGAASVGTASDQAELKSAVDALIGATKNMERENSTLREQLEASKSRSENLKREIELIRVESLTDPLTLVGNRQYFGDMLSKTIMKARESAAPVTLLFVDVDHFKQFNDDYGHQVGDDVLRLVASRLKSSVRDGEIARYGGEEFGIVLYNKTLGIGRLIAERIRLAIESAEMKSRSTSEPVRRITVSIGVAQWRSATNVDDLVRRADEALYAAKRKGRNCVVTELTGEESDENNAVARRQGQ